VIGLVQGPPVIGMVRGAVAGAGLGLASACDYLIADDTARFRFGYTAIGLSPDAGTSYFLPQLMGERAALQFALSNRIVPADEARAAGLVDEVVPSSEADSALRLRIDEISALHPDSVASSLRLLRGPNGVTALKDHLQAEADALFRNAERPETSRAIEAFLARTSSR
jgi:2-(1,2-epoxy-1,2-dihydrophenyl)acetyl-CoA isomerase